MILVESSETRLQVSPNLLDIVSQNPHFETYSGERDLQRIGSGDGERFINRLRSRIILGLVSPSQLESLSRDNILDLFHKLPSDQRARLEAVCNCKPKDGVGISLEQAAELVLNVLIIHTNSNGHGSLP